MKTLRNWRVWLGIGISAVCLWLALRAVNFPELGNMLAKANYIWLIPAFLAQFIAIVVRSQRWVVLLGNKVRLSDAFWAQCVGFLFTNTLPLRMGEPARVVVLSGRSGLPVVQIAATAIIERLLDVSTIVVAMILVLPFMQVPAFVVQAGITF